MRTNIDIDDAVLDAAMRAGPFKTKKDAVEAGLRLIARQAAYRELLRWEGKLHWDGETLDGGAGSEAGPAGLIPSPGIGAGRPMPALQAQEPGPRDLHTMPGKRHGGG